MEKIIKAVCSDDSDSRNNKHQTLLFSATVPSWVQQVARKYLRPDNKETVDLVTGQVCIEALIFRMPVSRRMAPMLVRTHVRIASHSTACARVSEVGTAFRH